MTGTVTVPWRWKAGRVITGHRRPVRTRKMHSPANTTKPGWKIWRWQLKWPVPKHLFISWPGHDGPEPDP
jgi:hypothetical protein